MPCLTSAIVVPVVAATAVPVGAAIVGAAVVGAAVVVTTAQAVALAEALGREFAERLQKPIEPEQLARPGVALRRFRTPIPAERLVHEATRHLDLDVGGTALLADTDGTPLAYATLLHDGNVVAAVRVAGQTTEVIAAEQDEGLIHAMVARAIGTALNEAADEQAYQVRVAPGSTPERIHMGARRVSHEDQRISVHAAWNQAGLALDLQTEGHLLDPDGVAHHPDLRPFLHRLGLEHPDDQHGQGRHRHRPPILPGPGPAARAAGPDRGASVRNQT